MDSVKGNEEKKVYLNQFMQCKDALKRIEEQIDEFEQQESSPRISNMDIGIHGSRGIKDLSDYIVKKDELMSKMIQARYKRVSTYSDIFQAIEAIPDEREQQVLTLRYIKGLKWEEIAVKMHVEWAQVHRIHAKALQHFKIPNEKS